MTDFTISHAELQQRVRYDPETGHFWRIGSGAGARYTQPMGGSNGSGGGWRYVMLRLDSQRCLAHRVAWFYMTGEWPQKQIDHANGDGLDNRWANLREASPSQNAANTRLRANRSGFKGVTWVPASKKWLGRIKVNGKLRGLGLFDTPEEAHRAYMAAAEEVFGEFARAA